MRSTAIYNNNSFSAHISPLFTTSFPAYLLIYFTVLNRAVSQPAIFSIVTQATPETCEEQWPLVRPTSSSARGNATQCWESVNGPIWLSQPSLSLLLCVRSALAMISLTILSTCLFSETKQLVNAVLYCVPECVSMCPLQAQ